MPARRNRRAMALRGVGPLMLLTLLAAAREGEAASVQIRADVILASNQGTGTDDRLGAVAKQLNDAFKYSRYELLSSPAGAAQVQQPWQAALPGGRTLEVTPTAIAEGNYVLQVRVLGSKGEPLMSSSVRLRPGGTVFIGGPPHPPGVLIIALSAS
jgi:hypothetical protein